LLQISFAGLGTLFKFLLFFSDGNGIYVDSSLTFGKTERCSTFNNPPLCKEGDFQIAAIEVFGLFRLDEF
jgi:hypothetical protein